MANNSGSEVPGSKKEWWVNIISAVHTPELVEDFSQIIPCHQLAGLKELEPMKPQARSA